MTSFLSKQAPPEMLEADLQPQSCWIPLGNLTEALRQFQTWVTSWTALRFCRSGQKESNKYLCCSETGAISKTLSWQRARLHDAAQGNLSDRGWRGGGHLHTSGCWEVRGMGGGGGFDAAYLVVRLRAALAASSSFWAWSSARCFSTDSLASVSALVFFSSMALLCLSFCLVFVRQRILRRSHQTLIIGNDLGKETYQKINRFMRQKNCRLGWKRIFIVTESGAQTKILHKSMRLWINHLNSTFKMINHLII